MTLRASVVVPTCGRPELLDRCLASLLDQDLDPRDYEVIVVDDQGSDETRCLVEGWSKRARARGVEVRYARTGSARGPAAARNVGWQAARSEIIAFTDDDCVPTPSWLRHGLEVFVDGVSAASGKVSMPLPDPPTDYERNASSIQDAEFVTANCFCRRGDLAAVGGFDERFKLPWREDTDFFFTLLEREKRVARAAAAIVVHPVRRPRWGISLAQQRKSVFNALLYKKHPDLYREHLPAPVAGYYAIVGAGVAALAGVLLRRPRLTWLSASLWTILTARFCVSRLRGTSRALRHLAEMVVTSSLIPPLAVFWRLWGAIKFRVYFL